MQIPYSRIVGGVYSCPTWYSYPLGSSELVVTMVNSCVSAECNIACKGGVRLFSFPKHYPELKKK